MYSFVKGPRLFMKGSRNVDDVDRVADANDRNMATTEDIANSSMSCNYKTKTHMASASQESREVFRSQQSRCGLKTVHTQRVVRKTTTVTRGERKEPISDIIQHDETISFKEVLLKWAQKTTEGYPGVKVTDFTKSWKDGLAFNAIINRNRPDLLDFRECKKKSARQNLETAFSIAEKELGITRLLDPEDVDTKHVDEKSMITYISSLYELWPEPANRNPLLDDEKLRKIEEYKTASSHLLSWIKKSITRLNNRDLPNTLHEMKNLENEHDRFRTEEIPPKSKEKQRLAYAYKEAVRFSQSLGRNYIDHELSSDNIEILWNRMMTAVQERDQVIINELRRLEKLQKLAEKLSRDIKQTNIRLDDLERKIIDEEKRVQTLHPLNAKFNCDQIESDLRGEGEHIKMMFDDVKVLCEERYHKASELQTKVEQIHQRWSNLKINFQNKVRDVLEARRKEALRKPITEEELIKTKADFRFLQECIEWVQARLKKLHSKDYGTDAQLIKFLLEEQKQEHNTIDDFQANVDKCINRKSAYQDKELEIYTHMLNKLSKSYSELLVMSNKRISDLETLYDFVQAATNELKWLSEKEEIEISRDWVAKNINFQQLKHHGEVLVSEMERREMQFNSIIEKGESYIRQRHPASDCIQSFISSMQHQWSWLTQLTNVFDVHFKNSIEYSEFYNEAEETSEWINKVEDSLNNTYSKQNFLIQEGERLLREMQNLKEEISEHSLVINNLISKSRIILPLKQRKAPLPRPIKVQSACMIKQKSATITKDEMVTLYDNSSKSKWHVRTISGTDVYAPGVAFVIPPPNQEAIEIAEELKRRYENLIALWTEKQHKLRQNMIFATLKIVKDWDFDTYANMDPHKRDSIIKALEDDIDKLAREGPPNDLGSRKLQDEMKALKDKFAEFDRRLREMVNEEALKSLNRQFAEAASPLLDILLEKERILLQRVNNPIPRDRESLQQLIIEHKDFDMSMRNLEPQVYEMNETFNNISKKSPQAQSKHDEINAVFERIKNLSSLFVERLKALEMVILNFEEASNIILMSEKQLLAQDIVSAEEVSLRRSFSELSDMQNVFSKNQKLFEELNSDVAKARRAVEKSRPKHGLNNDVTRLEEDTKNLLRRWENLLNEIISRLKLFETCVEFFQIYRSRMDQEKSWINQMHSKIQSLSTGIKIDMAQKLHNSVVDRKASIEETNVTGQRFIAEAKMLESLIKTFKESLQNQPKVDLLLFKQSRRVSASTVVEQELDHLNKEYQELLESLRRFLDTQSFKDFQDCYNSLHYWLAQKDKMFQFLGPIACEPRISATQVQQAQVMRDEFKFQEPQLKRLDNLARDCQQRLEKSSPESNRIDEQVQEIHNHWNHLLAKLTERERDLAAVCSVAKEFFSKADQLEANLQRISDEFDRLDDARLNSDEHLEALNSLDEDLILQRPLLADAESLAQRMFEILTDATSKNEIRYRLSALERFYNNLNRKINQRKAELQSSVKEDRDFNFSCDEIQKWLNQMEQTLFKELRISCRLDILNKQVSDFEPIYREVLDKEHQVHLLFNRGADMIAKSRKSDSRSIRNKLDNIKTQYDNIKKEATNRYTRFQRCLETCKRFHQVLDSFLPWLDLCEVKLSNLPELCCNRSMLEKQIKELQQLKHEILRHSQEFDNLKNVCDNLLSCCDVDKEDVQNEMVKIKRRWDELNKFVAERIRVIDCILNNLLEFQENARNLAHGLQRIEDRFESFGDEPKSLDRIRGLFNEAKGLEKDLNNTKISANELISECGKNVDTSQIKEEITELESRYRSLLQKLKDSESALTAASEVLSKFTLKLSSISNELNNLEERFEQMGPIAREISILQKQVKEIREFDERLSKVHRDIEEASRNCNDMISKGYITDSQGAREKLDSLSRQYNRLEEKSKKRFDGVNKMIDKLEKFYLEYQDADQDLKSTSKDEAAFKPLGHDVETIREQQQEFKSFIRLKVEPLGRKIEEVIRVGNSLIQSSSPGVDTLKLEQDVERLNEKWNDLKEKLHDRERKLEVALLQSGRFQEALAAVEKWLKEMEDMVANQKPPSADYKTVKNQLQEQKFLKKMLLDRQGSMTSLANMGKEFMKNLESREKSQIELQIGNLVNRYDNLMRDATQRLTTLETVATAARQFAEKLVPLQEWLDTTERKLQYLMTIPTDQEKIRQRIAEHRNLHQDILNHKHDFEELTEVAQSLISMIGDDEAAIVVDKLKEVTDRYAKLVEDSENLVHTLADYHESLGNFVLGFEDILAWIEEMEARLNRFRVLSIYFEKLQDQENDLVYINDEIGDHQKQVFDVISVGKEVMKHAPNDDVMQIREKLDALQAKFNDLKHKAVEKLRQAQDALPIAESFHGAHNRLNSWMDQTERDLKSLDSLGLNVQESTIQRIESEVPQNRSLLEQITQLGPQLGHISPGQGAAQVDGMIHKASRRFEAIYEQLQRKTEKIQLSKSRNVELMDELDELLDWFKDAAKQILEADGIRANPETILLLLKETKAMFEDIRAQQSRVRDVLTNAKQLMRESSLEDVAIIRDKSEELKDLSTHVSQLCTERLSNLEQALAYSQHFFDTHSELSQWLDDAEGECERLSTPALNESQIRRQQEKVKDLFQSIADHKPHIDRLNKFGDALKKLCPENEGYIITQILESDNNRYNALKTKLRDYQNTLEEAFQASSQFSDKLESMLHALKNTADQLRNAEPIAAHPFRIREQIAENNAILEDLNKRSKALDALKTTARDVIAKARPDDPVIKDIKNKLDKLGKLWTDVMDSANDRTRSLKDALKVAQKFWDELGSVMRALKEIQDNLISQDSPAIEPNAIKDQKDALQEIKHDIEQTKPEIDNVRQTGKELIQLVGEPEKPEIKKNIDDLENAWDTVTDLFYKREKNLADAMEKAMNFHDMLRSILDFLDFAENKFANLGPIASDIETVKDQIDQLRKFKAEVDSHMVEVEALNRQALELMERNPNQSGVLRKPINDINQRWNDLIKGIGNRKHELEDSLLRLGQFQHSLDEFLAWLTKTERELEEIKPTFGDPQFIEVTLAKLKVLMNDIDAHQTSLDGLTRAGRQLIESDRGSEDAGLTQTKLKNLNIRWQELQNKASFKQKELEDILNEALAFTQEIQDLLNWLSDLDSQFASSKPVGGLPETAREQLNRFMELYHELDSNRHKVESVLQQGHEYVQKSTDGATPNLQHNLKTLKSRWESILNRANDRKIKLEIALREAIEFHEALQSFMEWLTSAEKYLSTVGPVCLVLENIVPQIEEHNNFQKDVGNHRESIFNLDKKGTQLKYFSQKQDVILIKNSLISVQHRWERIVAKTAERARNLDRGYKEAKEFHDSWSSLIKWLSEAEAQLDAHQPVGNDPERIKQFLMKHKEFQRALGAKQSTYDATMKLGRTLKEKCPKSDVPILQNMLDELKTKWNAACNKSVDRQRRLEEALLYSGQFKEAIKALMDWLDQAKLQLGLDNLHGDLDTVTALVDQHRRFQEDFKSRSKNLASVRKTAQELIQNGTSEDISAIREQLSALEDKWNEVANLSDAKQRNLGEALRQAEQLHKAVHSLLEWLSDAEMKLRFVGSLPEDEEVTRQQIAEHERFMREMSSQEKNKESTISLAQEILNKCHPDAVSVIRHWISTIQSRWDEVYNWAKQREQKLKDHLNSLKNILEILEQLLDWLKKAEAKLLKAEAEPLPDDIPALERLIDEHQLFIDDLRSKEPEVDKIVKSLSSKRAISTQGKDNKMKRGSSQRLYTPANGHTKQYELEIKNPKARELAEKFKSVWELALDRMRRLQEKLDYLKEIERVKNFDFDDWRRQFLAWLNNKKARVMDFFRKIDTDNDGKVILDEFIEGFLKSKFPTSRMEMELVAPIFDRNNDGYIDHKEYLETLRPDRDVPKTEAEIIQDEVQRQVAKCTCVQRYKVFQVGEGKYRFGESQKLRLVRILRSTVMVRVGGGWVSLDEFLIKNDPCRAKGRTNIELRERFILADGVSQGMAAFKSKPLINPKTGEINTVGPITKIREKTERSLPMSRTQRCADHYTSDYSFTETESGSKSRPRSRVTLGSSRPGSRASSDMSNESLEVYQHRDRSQSQSRGNSRNRTSSCGRTNGIKERLK